LSQPGAVREDIERIPLGYWQFVVAGTDRPDPQVPTQDIGAFIQQRRIRDHDGCQVGVRRSDHDRQVGADAGGLPWRQGDSRWWVHDSLGPVVR
jgi:hypothetical protein